MSEEDLKALLVGKQLLLRGSFQGDSLKFSEFGDPLGHPLVGPYTLSGVEITKVHLSKKELELEGARYALHYLASTPNAEMKPTDDPANDVDRVKITPKKKTLKITIVRDKQDEPKAEKDKKSKKSAGHAQMPGAASGLTANEIAEGAKETAPKGAETAGAATAPTLDRQEAPGAAAAGPAADSAAHAGASLRGALDRIFAPGVDDALRAKLPEYWQLYFQGPKVLRYAPVDQQAKLTSPIAPQSNDFAQAAGISGQALYRVVVNTNGQPGTDCHSAADRIWAG